jgi:hypothetical protein
MTSRQATALTNHCRFAFETVHPRFSWIRHDEKGSIVLTVNSGYE